ncbi:hypothetical protein ACLOJK_002076 [Asimina triloba]
MSSHSHLFVPCFPGETETETETETPSASASASGLFLQVPALCSSTTTLHDECCCMNFHHRNAYVHLSSSQHDYDYDYDYDYDHRQISLDFLPHHQYPRPILAAASCPGLLLCFGLMHALSCYHYHVCNPLTKQWVLLPEPPIDHRPSLASHLGVGIVSDPPSGCEYNVVLFSAQRDKEDDDAWTSLEVATFSPFTGRWKQSTVELPKPLADTPTSFSGVSCNWVLYWLVESCDAVLAYSPSSGQCQLLALPARISAREKGTGFLGESGGRVWFADITGEARHPHLKTWALGADSEWCLQQSVAWRELKAGSPEWAKADEMEWEELVAKKPNIGASSYDAEDFGVVAFHPLHPNILFLRMWGGFIACDLQSKTLKELYRCRQHWNLLADHITPYLASTTRISPPTWAPPSDYPSSPTRIPAPTWALPSNYSILEGLQLARDLLFTSS